MTPKQIGWKLMQSRKQILSCSLLVLLLLFVESANAATITGAKYTETRITYQSVDVANRPVTLSAVLYYPMNTNLLGSVTTHKVIKYIFLNNHPTITDDASSPSGGESPLYSVSYMTSEDALVVCPDYIGYGETRTTTHPYLCQMLTARNVVDCLEAAIADAKTKTSFKDGYYTINCGYSQGGGVAMAVQRYLETEADEATQRLVNLRGSICGAGCYNLSQIMADYEQRTSISYPLILPFTIQGMKEGYAEGCMRGITLQDCFTARFWNAGVIDKLNAKQTNVDDLNNEIISLMGGKCSFYDVISEEFMDRTSAMYRAIHKVLKKNDLIDDEWVPSHPIVFYHYSQDEVVPFAGTQLAMTKWQSTGMVTLKKAEDITDYGAWNLAKLKYPNLKQNHRDYGTCFYLAVFDGQLTPAKKTDGYISTQAVTGEDRHEMTLNLPADHWNMVTFNSQVDGYYFGADALRYKVAKTVQDGHHVVRLSAMTDDEDFLSGTDYLIRPDVAAEKVTAMRSGLQVPVNSDVTPSASDDLAVQTSLTMVGTQSYATLFSPFCVNVPAGMEAYTAQLDGDKMQLVQLADGVIPAMTGVVLRGEAEGSCLFTYNANADVNAASELSGVLWDTPKAGNVLTLSTTTGQKVGFYKFTGNTLTGGKAFYQLSEGASTKGFVLSFDDDADAISEPQKGEETGTENIYDLQGRQLPRAAKGISIIRNADGTVRKIISVNNLRNLN